MKTILSIMVVLFVAACSSDRNNDKQSANRGTQVDPPLMSEQPDIQNLNRDRDLIQKQTERDFRTITPDTPQSENPHTSTGSGEIPREK